MNCNMKILFFKIVQLITIRRMTKMLTQTICQKKRRVIVM